jgi:hypothetical protein
MDVSFKNRRRFHKTNKAVKWSLLWFVGAEFRKEEYLPCQNHTQVVSTCSLANGKGFTDWRRGRVGDLGCV